MNFNLTFNDLVLAFADWESRPDTKPDYVCAKEILDCLANVQQQKHIEKLHKSIKKELGLQ